MHDLQHLQGEVHEHQDCQAIHNTVQVRQDVEYDLLTGVTLVLESVFVDKREYEYCIYGSLKEDQEEACYVDIQGPRDRLQAHLPC